MERNAAQDGELDRRDAAYPAWAAEARGLAHPFPLVVHRVFAALDASAGERREACQDAAPAAAVPFRDDAGRSADRVRAYRRPDVDLLAAIPSALQDEPAAEGPCIRGEAQFAA